MPSSFAILLSIFIVAALSTVQTQNNNNTSHSWTIVKPNSTQYINTLPFPNSVFKYQLRGHQTRGMFTLFEAEYLTDGPGRHIHTREDELFHVLEGQVQFYVDGRQYCGSSGDYMYVPRNMPQAIRVHNVRNGTKPVRIQIMLTPSGLEGFLDEIAPLYYTGQDNVTLQNEIAVKYGIINLDPVQWEDLGCFNEKPIPPKDPNNSNKAPTHFSSLISFVNNFF